MLFLLISSTAEQKKAGWLSELDQEQRDVFQQITRHLYKAHNNFSLENAQQEIVKKREKMAFGEVKKHTPDLYGLPMLPSTFRVSFVKACDCHTEHAHSTFVGLAIGYNLTEPTDIEHHILGIKKISKLTTSTGSKKDNYHTDMVIAAAFKKVFNKVMAVSVLLSHIVTRIPGLPLLVRRW